MSVLEISLLVGAVVFVLFCGLVALGLVALGVRKRRSAGAPSAPFAMPARVTAPAHVDHLSVENLRRLKADEAAKKEAAELEALRQKEVDRLLGTSAEAPKA